MADDVNRHKLSDAHKRRAEHIKDKLEDKGLGQDHADKESKAQVMEEMGPSMGGNNSGAIPSKHVNFEGQRRAGSDKKAHSGQP